MNLGLRPSNFDFIYNATSLLKRDLLFFDQIHICTHQVVTVFDDLRHIDPEYCDKMEREFDFLKKYGMLCDLNLGSLLDWTAKEFMKLKEKSNPVDNFDLLGIIEALNAVPKPLSPNKFSKNPDVEKALKIIGKYKKSVNKTENATVRIASVFLNRYASKDNATALLHNETPMDLPNFKQATVLEIVLRNLPIPDENVTWQQIVEYRADPDSSAKFTALKVWMQDIASKEYSGHEIEERIEHLLNEYEHHLAFHKLKFERGTRHILLNGPLEIFENLFKMNWSTSGKKLFALEEKQFDLMDAELKAPGKEVAYISKTKKRFS